MITLVAQFRMKAGKEKRALALVNAVRRESERSQPQTLQYLVHRILDKNKKPSRDLVFYECYRNGRALNAHLASPSWKALEAAWRECFEGPSSKAIKVMSLDRLGGFVRLDVR